MFLPDYYFKHLNNKNDFNGQEFFFLHHLQIIILELFNLGRIIIVKCNIIHLKVLLIQRAETVSFANPLEFEIMFTQIILITFSFIASPNFVINMLLLVIN